MRIRSVLEMPPEITLIRGMVNEEEEEEDGAGCSAGVSRSTAFTLYLSCGTHPSITRAAQTAVTSSSPHP